MKHYPSQSATALHPFLQRMLETCRANEAFDAVTIADLKAERLNAYLAENGLKGCVVAVSGGIDSAVVLALVHRASKMQDSPIQRVVPVLLPVFTPGAATNQDTATARGQELCARLKLEPVSIDLSSAHQTTQALVEGAMGVTAQGWASGQLVAYQRTPALYFVTSLLAQQGTPSVLVGTTNEDEGAYLGYFGKASDGMVDLQLISDCSKHQVYQLGAILDVPSSIMNVTPTGDMYDGRVDEEVFGAPYDFVELFQYVKKKPFLREHLELAPVEALDQFSKLSQQLEQLHQYNRHKYFGRSPAVHLDVKPVAFSGSWNYSVYVPGAKDAQ